MTPLSVTYYLNGPLPVDGGQVSTQSVVDDVQFVIFCEGCETEASNEAVLVILLWYGAHG